MTAPMPQNPTLPIPAQHKNVQRPADPLRDYITVRAQMSGAAFSPVLERFKTAALAMQCKYTPEQLVQYKGDAIYLGIINAKARTAAAWILDVLANHVERPWTLQPSPITELPPEMQQIVQDRLNVEAEAMGIDPSILTEAKDQLIDLAKTHATDVAEESVKRLETFIEDMLTESGWAREFEAFVHDVVLYPYGAMISPVAEPKRKLKHAMGAEGGVSVQEDISLAARRLAPYAVIPSPNATDTHTCEYVFVHDEMTPDELSAAKRMEGFDPNAIDTALEIGIPSYSVASHGNTEFEPPYMKMIREIEQGGQLYGNAGQGFRRMRYFGRIPNRLLMERGLGDFESRHMHDNSLVEGVSECEIWIVNGVMIRAIVVSDFIDKRPIHIASFVKVPGSLIGRGLGDELMPYQRMVNALARAMVRNYGYASGPITEMNVSKLAEGEDEISELAPYRVYRSDPDPIAGDNGPMLNVFTIPSLAQELMSVLETYMKLADQHSGIPAYALGMGEMSGVARTASGLSMLMTNAAKSIKLVFRNIDGAVSDIIQMIIYWVLLYHPDETMKAEAQVISRGATGLLQRELAQSKTFELLQLLQPYVQLGAIPPETILMLLRKVVDSQGFDPDSLMIPDPKRQMQLQAAAQGQGQQQQQQQQGGQMPPQAGPAPTSNAPQFSQSTPKGDGRFVPNPQGADPIKA